MKYAVQMYSIRSYVAENGLRAGLEKVAEIGYKGVEFAGFFDNSAEDVRAWLEELGLEVFSTHTGIKELYPEVIEKTIAYHKTLGNKLLIIPGINMKTREDLDETIRIMNYAQPILKEAGITLAFHNHYKEFILTDYNAIVMDEFLTKTNVNFQIDTFWAFYAGQEPVSLLEKMKDRLVSVHLKDGLADKTGRSLGEGEAPVEKVLDKAIELGMPIVVESEGEDPTGPDEITRCFKFLESLGK